MTTTQPTWIHGVRVDRYACSRRTFGLASGAPWKTTAAARTRVAGYAERKNAGKRNAKITRTHNTDMYLSRWKQQAKWPRTCRQGVERSLAGAAADRAVQCVHRDKIPCMSSAGGVHHRARPPDDSANRHAPTDTVPVFGAPNSPVEFLIGVSITGFHIRKLYDVRHVDTAAGFTVFPSYTFLFRVYILPPRPTLIYRCGYTVFGVQFTFSCGVLLCCWAVLDFCVKKYWNLNWARLCIQQHSAPTPLSGTIIFFFAQASLFFVILLLRVGTHADCTTVREYL